MGTAEQYPEHARQEAVIEQAEIIGRFIDTSGYTLAQYEPVEGSRDDVLFPVNTPIRQILAGYFGIDLSKIEAEKRAMIDALNQA